MKWIVLAGIFVFISNSALAEPKPKHGDGQPAEKAREADPFPQASKVMEALTKWFSESDSSKRDLNNDALTIAFSADESKEATALMKRIIWYKGRLDAQCSNDASSEHFNEMLDLCFGSAGLYRGYKAGRDDKSKELKLSFGEMKACRENFKDLFSAKREKAGDSRSEFKVEWDVAKKIDDLFALLLKGVENNAEVSDEDAIKAIADQKKAVEAGKSAIEDLSTEALCRVTDPKADTSNATGREEDTTGKSGNDGTPLVRKPGTSSNANGSSQPNNGLPAIATPSASGYGGYQPSLSAVGSPVVPNNVDPYGLGACGAYGSCGGLGQYQPRGDYGGGYVPSPPPPGAVPASPAFAPIPPFSGGGFGVGVGVKTGPKYPVQPYPMPYMPPMMPLFTDMSAGSVKPWQSDTVTVTVTTRDNEPTKSTGMGIVPQTCGKPVCMPMFGGFAMRNQMGINPYIRNPYLPVYSPIMQNPNTLIPPSIVMNPQYPGTIQNPMNPTVTPYPQTPGTTYPPVGIPQYNYPGTTPIRYNLPRTS